MTPIEQTPSGAIVATGDGIRLYQFMATKYALKLRANGIQVTSKFPTVKTFVKQWKVDPPVRTYSELYEVFLVREALWDRHGRQDIGWLTTGKATDGNRS